MRPAATSCSHDCGRVPVLLRELVDDPLQRVDLIERVELRQPQLRGLPQPCVLGLTDLLPHAARGLAIAAAGQHDGRVRLQPPGRAGHIAAALEPLRGAARNRAGASNR